MECDVLETVLEQPRTPPAWKTIYMQLDRIEDYITDGGRLQVLADALSISRAGISQALRKARAYRVEHGRYKAQVIPMTSKTKETQIKQDAGDKPPSGFVSEASTKKENLYEE